MLKTVVKKFHHYTGYFETKEGKYFLAILIISFFLRLPSLNEPTWYGDEGVTFTQALAPLHGLTMYKDIFDNKPPFSYLLASAAFALLGPTQWAARLVLLIWVLATQISLFVLVKKLFSSKIALISTVIFALTINTPYFEGNIYNGEILMIMPTILGIFFGLQKRYLLSGILLVTA